MVTTYTATSQIDTVTDGSGLTDYDYDAADRLTKVSYPTGQFIEYGYDATGNKVTLRSGSHTVTYTYTALNQLETVTDENGTTTYGYDEVGHQTRVAYPNGATTETVVDGVGHTQQVTSRDSHGTVIAETLYTLDPAGHRKSLTELNRTVDYAYDELYRLTGETITDATGVRSTTWSYDKVGNRKSQTVTVNGLTTETLYAYDKNDRLLSTTEGAKVVTYGYDDNGNTTSKSENGTTLVYGYNPADRLVSVTGGTQSLAFDYHPDGIRRSRSVDGQSTYFLVDPNQPYAQVLGEFQNATEQVFYTYGTDLLSQKRTAGTNWYHYDALGSTRALSGPTGLTTDTYSYLAFGETDSSTGGSENAYLFAGEQFDPVLSLYYLRARHYEPRHGRLTEFDSFGGFDESPTTLHKYGYAGWNPVSYIDPSGHTFLASQIIGIDLQIDTGRRIRAAGVEAGRQNFNRVLFGRPPEDWGLIGNMIMDNLLGAVEEAIQVGTYQDKGAFGTAAHQNLKKRLEFAPIPGVRSEVFVDSKGRGTRQTELGSLGIDIAVYYDAKIALLIDLKTGRGFSGGKRREIKTRFEQMSGGREVPIVQVFFRLR